MNKFKDKNGAIIKHNDLIENIYNEPKQLKIIEVNGKLCFEIDNEPLTSAYCTDEFWEIIEL